jgi:hypothetical protein
MKVITPEQYREGYAQLTGLHTLPNVVDKSYELIRKLPDGNYLVKNPG